MAKNEVRVEGKRMRVKVTSPAPVASTTPASGDPVLYGQRPGVADTTTAADLTTTVHFDGVYNLSVKGIGVANANTAVNNGDKIFFTVGDVPPLSVKPDAAAVLFGFAHALPDPTAANPLVAAGATTTIAVKIART